MEWEIMVLMCHLIMQYWIYWRNMKTTDKNDYIDCRSIPKIQVFSKYMSLLSKDMSLFQFSESIWSVFFESAPRSLGSPHWQKNHSTNGSKNEKSEQMLKPIKQVRSICLRFLDRPWREKDSTERRGDKSVLLMWWWAALGDKRAVLTVWSSYCIFSFRPLSFITNQNKHSI